MRKPKVTTLDKIHDEAALFRLGAWRVGEIRDKQGTLVGQEVEPVIDMAGYPAALAAVEAARLADQWAAMRAERNRRLAACDWTQMLDAPLVSAQRDAWLAYRQALRDMPAVAVSPTEFVWPVPPS